jgi:Glycosyltransferase family 87
MTSRRISPGVWFWMGFIAIISTLMLTGNQRTVTHAYRGGAEAWSRGEPIYNGLGVGFVYLPQAAILFIPFTWPPFEIGEVLWRCLTIGGFAWGLSRLASLLPFADNFLFFRLSLLAGLLAVPCALNGQATLLMAGLMMVALADLVQQRFTRSAVWLSLGLAVKPLIVVLILLVAALYAPLRWRLLVGVATVFLLPFLTQNPSFVVEQCRLARIELRIAAASGDTIPWANLFGSMKVFGLDVPAGWKMTVNLAAALIVLALAYAIKARYSPEQTAIWLYALAACYLMLFNPRTENNTYSMLGPAIALSCAIAWQERRYALAIGHIIISLGIVSGYEIAQCFTPPAQSVWLCPWLGALYFFLLIAEFRPDRLHLEPQV